MTDANVELSLWLGKRIASQDPSQVHIIMLDEIAEQISEGTSLDAAIRSVRTHDTHAGDFGVDIGGSLVAVALIQGLKVFWTAYLKEFEEKAGKVLADATVDFVKKKFARDVSGPEGPVVQAKVVAAVAAAAQDLNVKPEEIKPVINSLNLAAMDDLDSTG